MKKLLDYLNSMSVDEQVAFALSCGTTVGYLRKACSKGQTIGAEICAQIDVNSRGAVSRSDLRPLDFQRIWPEICGSLIGACISDSSAVTAGTEAAVCEQRRAA